MQHHLALAARPEASEAYAQLSDILMYAELLITKAIVVGHAVAGRRHSANLPDAACLGAEEAGGALVGDADLLANCAPTALSKKPPPEEVGLGEVGLEEVGLWEVGLGDAALVGVSDFFANWAPTALSKKPPPEEAGLEVPATGGQIVGPHECMESQE